ncbi:gamma-glutamylcyclotransferase [soil metagenome]
MHPDRMTTLATYGTLRPGRSNHDQLNGLRGDWIGGTVRGVLYDEGWGAAEGYPGLVPDPLAEPVEVDVFRSDDLPDHWGRLDAFEGEGYARVTVEVETAEGPVSACLYALVAEKTDANV